MAIYVNLISEFFVEPKQFSTYHQRLYLLNYNIYYFSCKEYMAKKIFGVRQILMERY